MLSGAKHLTILQHRLLADAWSDTVTGASGHLGTNVRIRHR